MLFAGSLTKFILGVVRDFRQISKLAFNDMVIPYRPIIN
jgi:hypothetical protein